MDYSNNSNNNDYDEDEDENDGPSGLPLHEEGDDDDNDNDDNDRLRRRRAPTTNNNNRDSSSDDEEEEEEEDDDEDNHHQDEDESIPKQTRTTTATTAAVMTSPPPPMRSGPQVIVARLSSSSALDLVTTGSPSGKQIVVGTTRSPSMAHLFSPISPPPPPPPPATMTTTTATTTTTPASASTSSAAMPTSNNSIPPRGGAGAGARLPPLPPPPHPQQLPRPMLRSMSMTPGLGVSSSSSSTSSPPFSPLSPAANAGAGAEARKLSAGLPERFMSHMLGPIFESMLEESNALERLTSQATEVDKQLLTWRSLLYEIRIHCMVLLQTFETVVNLSTYVKPINDNVMELLNRREKLAEHFGKGEELAAEMKAIKDAIRFFMSTSKNLSDFVQNSESVKEGIENQKLSSLLLAHTLQSFVKSATTASEKAIAAKEDLRHARSSSSVITNSSTVSARRGEKPKNMPLRKERHSKNPGRRSPYAMEARKEHRSSVPDALDGADAKPNRFSLQKSVTSPDFRMPIGSNPGRRIAKSASVESLTDRKDKTPARRNTLANYKSADDDEISRREKRRRKRSNTGHMSHQSSKDEEGEGKRRRKPRTKGADHIKNKQEILRQPRVKQYDVETMQKSQLTVQQLSQAGPNSLRHPLLRADSEEVVQVSPLIDFTHLSNLSIKGDADNAATPSRGLEFRDAESKFLEKAKSLAVGQIIRVTEDSKIVLVLEKTENKLIIIAGILPKLIQKLADEKEPDYDYIDCFLVTHTQLLTSIELMEHLISRFNITLPSNPSMEEVTFFALNAKIIQTRVLQVCQRWVKLNYYDFEQNRELLELLESLVDYAKSQDFIQEANFIKGAIAQQAEKSQFRKDKVIIDSLIKSRISYQPIVVEQSIFADVEPQKVAEQLALADAAAFRSISAGDFLRYMVFTSQKRLAMVNKATVPLEEVHSVELFLKRSNQISNWVALEIVQLSKQKNRKLAIRKFIQIAKVTQDMQDFSCSFAIMNGLYSPPVRRLKKSWDGLSKQETQWMDGLSKLMDPTNNLGNFRKVLEQAKPPIVPFFPIIQRELLYIQEKNATTVENLLNFNKFRQMAYVIFRYVDYLHPPYPFSRNESLSLKLEDAIASAPPENLLQELSQRHEDL